MIDTGNPLDNPDPDGTRVDIGKYSITQTQFTGPTVSVTAPAAGGTVGGGVPTVVRWTATSPVGVRDNSINIYYSLNNGSTYSLLSQGHANDGIYTWNVPASTSTTAKIKIEASDWAPINQTGNISTFETLAFSIVITSPEVSSSSPTDGSTVPLNSTIDIKFSRDMDKASVENAFLLSEGGTPIAGTFSWIGSNEVIFTPLVPFPEDKTYVFAVETTACDTLGFPLNSRLSISFKTAASTNAPTIVIYRIDDLGSSVALRDGDSITKQPHLRGTLYDLVGIKLSSIALLIDDVQVSFVTGDVTSTDVSLTYSVTAALADGSHKIKLVGQNNDSRETQKEIINLSVSSSSNKVVGEILTFPTVFKPGTGSLVKIAYNLNSEGEVTIRIINTVGENVWTEKCMVGTNGGRAGYNEAFFDGISQLDGGSLGNGIYLVQIISGRNVLGTGHLVIKN